MWYALKKRRGDVEVDGGRVSGAGDSNGMHGGFGGWDLEVD